MRGFLAGSFALIVLYVFVQPGAASKAQTGSNILVSLMQRALSPQVAGIPNRSTDHAGNAKGAGQAAANAAKGLATGQAGAIGAAGGDAINKWLASQPGAQH